MTAPGTNEPSKRRLGRGLSSLIVSTAAPTEDPAAGQYVPAEPAQASAPQAAPAALDAPAAAPPDPAAGAPGERTTEIAIDQISPNPYQPRRSFNDEELRELTASIAAEGVLQPLIVTSGAEHAVALPFVLIAGERRLRAAKAAGLTTVPCVTRQATARQMLEWAIIENIHRSDLNAVDRAIAYRDYMDRFQLTQADAADRLGVARASLANFLRILDLPDSVQRFLLDGAISFGHAKALAGLAGKPDRQEALAQRTSDNQLSVRQLEGLIADEQSQLFPVTATSAGKETKAPYIRDLEDQLTAAVGTRVQIRPGRAKNTGKILIDFYGLEDFDRIASALGLKVTS
ncbi:MAG: ParB/RepB/Spo0J family partition protein [Planctomycetota bacterium]|nr:ParB/RepB/Spo0J family partition protein [Planctomycetota bacterium]